MNHIVISHSLQNVKLENKFYKSLFKTHRNLVYNLY